MPAKQLLRTIIIALVGLSGCLAAEPTDIGTTEQEIADPPMNLTGAAISSTRINLAWDPVPGASKYIIMMGPSSGTETTLTSAPAVPTAYSQGHLMPGQSTCWQVKSVVGVEVSVPSNEVCLTTSTAPGAPTNVVATPTSQSTITVSWNAVPGALRYYVFQAAALAGPYSNIGTSSGTSRKVSNLQPNTTYYFKVQTQYSGGTSAQSEPAASATTFGAGLQAYYRLDEDAGTVANDSSGFNRHGALTGGTAFTSADKAPIDNNFSSVSIPGGAADAISVPHNTAFNFQSSPGAGPDFTVALWVKLPTNPGAATVRIAGKRVLGCGAFSWELGQDATSLYFRGNTTLSFGQRLPVGAWTHLAVTRAAGTVTLYLGGVSVATGAVTIGNANTGPLQFGNAGNCGGGAGMIVDDAKVLSRALSASEILIVGDVPEAPANLQGSVTSPTGIHLTWNAVPNAQKYTIYFGSASGNEVFLTNTSAADTIYDNGHLMPNQTTSWQVGVTVNGLDSPRSNEVILTTQGAPSPPTDVMATAISDSRIDLSWTEVANAGKYYVYQSENGGVFEFKGTADASATPTFGAAGLTANTMYTYVVRTVALDLVTESADSAPASATTLP